MRIVFRGIGAHVLSYGKYSESTKIGFKVKNQRQISLKYNHFWGHNRTHFYVSTKLYMYLFLFVVLFSFIARKHTRMAVSLRGIWDHRANLVCALPYHFCLSNASIRSFSRPSFPLSFPPLCTAENFRRF